MPTPRGAVPWPRQAALLPVGGPALPVGLARQPTQVTGSRLLSVRELTVHMLPPTAHRLQRHFYLHLAPS